MMPTDEGTTGTLSLDQQRLREQALLTEIDLLRRTLVRCTLAIRDPAPPIELCLRDLRQALRGKETVARLRALLPRLENVLAESEFVRDTRVNRELAALSAQVARLEGQILPQTLREAIGEFARGLSRSPSRPTELVALHKAFGDLQWQVLEHLFIQRSNASAGLFKRLLGSQGNAVPASQDNGQVAEGFAQVLRALLSQSALPLKYQIELRRLLACLHGDVDSDALVRLVDGLGELVLESGEDQRQLLEFLVTLNERLGEVQASLETLGCERAEGSALAEALEQSLLERVGDMRSAVEEAADLETLRQSISCRLEALLDGLEAQRSQREAREEALAASLRQLSARVQELEREAEVCRDQLNEQRRAALRDPLTGLGNRTAWNAELRQALERRQVLPGELALAVLDVDHFKQVNDRFGHLAGDKVLKLIAEIIRQRLPEEGFLARYGGEEFVLLLPGYDLASARTLLQDLLAGIEACPFHFKGERLPVTLSGGLACFGAAEEDPDEVFLRADQALYQAKQKGRNRLVVDGLPELADNP